MQLLGARLDAFADTEYFAREGFAAEMYGSALSEFYPGSCKLCMCLFWL
jgi:hypothetical protein